MGVSWLATMGVEHELILGMYMAMAGGVPSFAYSSFSSTIKQRHGYSPSEINYIGSFMQAGVWTAVLGGIMLDRFGPRTCSAASLLLGGAGWSTMYALTTSDSAIGVNWGAYAAAGYCAGQGCAYLYMVSLKVVQTNTPDFMRGRAVSMLATWVSLAAGVYSILGTAVFKGADFFLLLVSAHAVQCLIGCTMRVHIPEETFNRNRMRRILRIIAAISLVSATVVFISGLLGSSVVTALLTGLCVIAPLFLLGAVHCMPSDTSTDESTALTAKGSQRDPSEPELPHSSPAQSSRRPIDYVGGAWFFISYFFFFGPTAAALNVLAMLVMSRAGLVQGYTYDKQVEDVPHETFIVTLITTFAVFNTLGRIATGMGVDATREKVPLAAWLTAWASTISLGLFLLSIGGSWAEQAIAAAVMGFGVGGAQASVPRLTAEIFGLQHFAKALSCMAFAPSMGTLLFGRMYAAMEEHHEDTSFAYIQEDNHTAPVRYCVGEDCLHDALQIGAGSALFGALLAAGLWRRCCCQPRVALLDSEDSHSAVVNCVESDSEEVAE